MSDTEDLSALSPQQKIARINELRQRVLSGEDVSIDDLAMGVRLLRDIRGTTSARGAKTPAAAKPLSLSDF